MCVYLLHVPLLDPSYPREHLHIFSRSQLHVERVELRAVSEVAESGGRACRDSRTTSKNLNGRYNTATLSVLRAILCKRWKGQCNVVALDWPLPEYLNFAMSDLQSACHHAEHCRLSWILYSSKIAERYAPTNDNLQDNLHSHKLKL